MSLIDFDPDERFVEITEELWQYVHTRDNGICQICALKGTQAHHIIYRSQGGANCANNLILLCLPCHHTVVHARYSVGPQLLIKRLMENEEKLRANLV